MTLSDELPVGKFTSSRAGKDSPVTSVIGRIYSLGSLFSLVIQQQEEMEGKKEEARLQRGKSWDVEEDRIQLLITRQTDDARDHYTITDGNETLQPKLNFICLFATDCFFEATAKIRYFQVPIRQVDAPTVELGLNSIISAIGLQNWATSELRSLWKVSFINNRKGNHSTSLSFLMPVESDARSSPVWLNSSLPVAGAALFTHISICIAVQADLCVHVNINMVDDYQASWKRVKLQVCAEKVGYTRKKMIFLCSTRSLSSLLLGSVPPVKHILFDVYQITQSPWGSLILRSTLCVLA